jgi:hypothetical protein
MMLTIVVLLVVALIAVTKLLYIVARERSELWAEVFILTLQLESYKVALSAQRPTNTLANELADRLMESDTTAGGNS